MEWATPMMVESQCLTHNVYNKDTFGFSWGFFRFGESRTLGTGISLVRKAVGNDFGRFRYISVHNGVEFDDCN